MSGGPRARDKWPGGAHGDGGDGYGKDNGEAVRRRKALRRSRRTGRFAGRSWRRRNDVISEHATVIKILVSYLQVVSLVNNTPVTWPHVLATYFDVAAQASSAASSLASLDCNMRSHAVPKSVQTFFIGVASPLYWSLGLCLFWLLRGLWLRWRGRLRQSGELLAFLRMRMIITINCVIFIQYPSVVSQLFSLFSCLQVDVGPPQMVCVDPWDTSTCSVDRLSTGLYWTQDLEQRCYRGAHLTLCLAVGVPGVLCFAAGIPLLSAWWLYRNRSRLRDEQFSALYGTLYQEYEDGYYYWESIVMLRKFAITAVIVFAGTYRWQLTLLLALGVIAIALMAQVACRPFESDAMDELERLGLVTTLVTFYLATYFLGDTVGSSVRVGLSLAILVLNAVTVFILVVAILRELHRAALYKLLRISSARGNLPLSFVLRVGLLYFAWRARVLWTHLRIRLYRAAPCCFMPFPPGACPETVARAEMAVASPGARVSGAGGSNRRRLSLVERYRQRAATDASVNANAAALTAAWDHYLHETWLNHVVLLAERVPQAGGSFVSESAINAGRMEVRRWRRLPGDMLQGVKRAARSVGNLRSSLALKLSANKWGRTISALTAGRQDGACTDTDSEVANEDEDGGVPSDEEAAAAFSSRPLVDRRARDRRQGSVPNDMEISCSPLSSTACRPPARSPSSPAPRLLPQFSWRGRLRSEEGLPPALAATPAPAPAPAIVPGAPLPAPAVAPAPAASAADRRKTPLAAWFPTSAAYMVDLLDLAEGASPNGPAHQAPSAVAQGPPFRDTSSHPPSGALQGHSQHRQTAASFVAFAIPEHVLTDDDEPEPETVVSSPMLSPAPSRGSTRPLSRLMSCDADRPTRNSGFAAPLLQSTSSGKSCFAGVAIPVGGAARPIAEAASTSSNVSCRTIRGIYADGRPSSLAGTFSFPAASGGGAACGSCGLGGCSGACRSSNHRWRGPMDEVELLEAADVWAGPGQPQVTPGSSSEDEESNRQFGLVRIELSE